MLAVGDHAGVDAGDELELGLRLAAVDWPDSLTNSLPVHPSQSLPGVLPFEHLCTRIGDLRK